MVSIGAQGRGRVVVHNIIEVRGEKDTRRTSLTEPSKQGKKETEAGSQGPTWVHGSAPGPLHICWL